MTTGPRAGLELGKECFHSIPDLKVKKGKKDDHMSILNGRINIFFDELHGLFFGRFCDIFKNKLKMLPGNFSRLMSSLVKLSICRFAFHPSIYTYDVCMLLSLCFGTHIYVTLSSDMSMEV